MKKYLLIVGMALMGTANLVAAPKVVHVFVALCDNDNQGIVPVPKSLGNGQDANSNLYWGAMYGVKTWFKKSADWKLVQNLKSPDKVVLEQVVFKHTSKDVYLVAEAYDGRHMKKTLEHFFNAAAGNNERQLKVGSISIGIGGGADLVAFIGHNGLMDVSLDSIPSGKENDKQAIVLACISKDYFRQPLKKTKAYPLLLTTGFMAPEAYTLESAVSAWIQEKTSAEVREAAAIAYNKYQKCGMKGARNLFTYGE